MGAAMVYAGIYLFAAFSVIGVMELLVEARKKTVEAKLSQTLELWRGELRQQREQLEEQYPGIFDRVERMLADTRDPESLADEMKNALRMALDMEVRHSSCEVDLSQPPSAELNSRALNCATNEDVSLQGAGGLLSLRLAGRIICFERKLATLEVAPPLQGLCTSERILGLVACFVLAATLAGIVLILGSVDGANSALKALQ
jgi:hypothetical protein